MKKMFHFPSGAVSKTAFAVFILISAVCFVFRYDISYYLAGCLFLLAAALFGAIGFLQPVNIKNEEISAEIENIVKKAKNVFLMGHKRADFDSFGACAGIYALCRKHKKKCFIVMGIDVFAVKDIYDKFLIDGAYDGVFIPAHKADSMVSENSLVVVLDTHSKDIIEKYEIYEKAGKRLIIDHHKNGFDDIAKADIVCVKTEYSSTCEIVASILMDLNIYIRPVEAEAMLAGIVVDTRDFGVNSGEHVFLTAAYLCRCGADSSVVRNLFKSTMRLERAKAGAVENSVIYKDGIIFSKCEESHKNIYLACARAADELLGVKGVKASFVLCQYSGMVYVSARSNGDVDVQAILKKVGGGGHSAMAGAQFEGKSILNVEELLKEAVDEYLLEVDENESNTSSRC